ALAVGTVLLGAANQRTRQALAAAQANQRKSEANYQLARAAVDRYFTQVSEARLLNEPRMDRLRRDLLETAREFEEAFVRERGDAPQAVAELGGPYLRLEKLTPAIGGRPRAIEQNDRAVRLFRQLSRDRPQDDSARRDLAEGLRHLGLLQRDIGSVDKARAL